MVIAQPKKESKLLLQTRSQKSIEDKIYQNSDSKEEQFEVLNQIDNDCNKEKSEMEIDGFFKHFDENQIIYTENDKEELLKKFAGYIDYRVKKQIPFVGVI